MEQQEFNIVQYEGLFDDTRSALYRVVACCINRHNIKIMIASVL